jgi:hypothetical protein
LHVALPHTRDPRALAEFSAAADFSYGADGVRLRGLKAALDDTHITGSVALVGEPRALEFELALDQVDVQRYLSAAGESGGVATPEPAAREAAAREAAMPDVVADAASGPGGAAGAAQARGRTGLAALGTLTVGAVHFAPLDFSNVEVRVAARTGWCDCIRRWRSSMAAAIRGTLRWIGGRRCRF